MLKQLAQTGLGGTIGGPSSRFNFKNDPGGTQAARQLDSTISLILGVITLIAAIYFLFTFLVAAFNWMSSSGDSSKVQKARDMMLQAVIGLILVVATYAIVGFIGNVVGIDILNPGEMILNLDSPTKNKL